MWRAVNGFRVGALVYATVLVLGDRGDDAHPRLALVAVAVMVVWTGVVGLLYAVDRGRRLLVAGVDLAVSAALVLATLLVQTRAEIAASAPTVPSVWAAGPVLAMAVLLGGRGGGLAAGVLVVADLVVVGGDAGQSTLNGAVLLVLAGTVLGRMIRVGLAAEAQLAQDARERAAVAERDRLARVVHDGVLQVLALTARRGPQLGGDGPELARLAGEQERALRALVSGRAAPAVAGTADLTALVGRPPGVEVVAPAGPVPLPSGDAAELMAAVRAVLDNAARHAPGAAVHLLVEDLGDQVVVTVRDEGPGIPAGREQAAAAEGRLGLAGSVRGRVADLGGTVDVVSAPGQGCEVEISVPRRG